MATFAERLAAKVLASKAALAAKKGTVKLKPGNNRVVVLQGWEENKEEDFYQSFGQHYIKAADGSVLATAVCAHRTHGLPCEICTAIQGAARSVDDETVNLLKEGQSAQGYLMNVLLPESDTPNSPQIIEVRESVLKGILNVLEEWGPEALEKEFIINKEGTGLNTKYSVTPSPKKANIPADALKQLHDLSNWVKAKEGEERTQMAKLSVAKVAGLLGDGSGVDTPRTSAKALSGPKTKPADEEFDDLPAFDGATTVEAASSDKSGGISLDEELADLLS